MTDPRDPPTTAEIDRAAAFRRGHAAGRNREVSAATCPYGHEPGTFDLRMAWMDGFSKGRTDTDH